MALLAKFSLLILASIVFVMLVQIWTRDWSK